jgi:hypothetical protein
MSQQRVAEVRAAWDFAFARPVSDANLNRLCGWAQAFGVPVLSRACERAASAGDDMPEEQAVETVRLVLRDWRSRGWV